MSDDHERWKISTVLRPKGRLGVMGSVETARLRIEALLAAERVAAKAPERSRTERVCHKAAAQAYENALAALEETEVEKSARIEQRKMAAFRDAGVIFG